ncbi:hypothetical protein AJ78_00441 [Emergomyces pasteurianus Ep9510]|uniref:Uncharacterized protein n=1 Tax=Emergomyces pasteurianus Ep9510 TaxID=1447872 RepID=A0A1J9PT46_9EURO|nr:hypothetical protein AJ78_00441 [Emergomyces pasteurianus Ep9510]
MSGLRGMVKDGWHPKGKDGGKESWRGDFKGINQVAGWVGKGKSNSDGRAEHASRPLASLKDPASFPPPPKHINRHGGGGVSSPTSASQLNGLGAPLSTSEIQSLRQREQQERQAEEAESPKKAPPPVPFRANTTGLSTDNFLPPPTRQVSASPGPAEQLRPKPAPKPKPSLPPRLPPRTATHLSPSPSPPPAYDSSPKGLVAPVNQGAINRLGNAGVSVPSLGIINRADSGQRETGTKSAGSASPYAPQNELQARFSRMNTASPISTSSAPARPTEGTTVEQKQHAVRTAHSFSRDPTSVSTSDARSAASTARNFRERHSDQIDSGKKKLIQIDQKYGISKRINSFIEDQKSPAYPDSQPSPHANAAYSPQSPSPNAFNRSDLEALNNRKPPPPPPPPKKPSIQALPVDGTSQVSPPPPLPLGTKPR